MFWWPCLAAGLFLSALFDHLRDLVDHTVQLALLEGQRNQVVVVGFRPVRPPAVGSAETLSQSAPRT
jgi:hypothetical protein